MSGPIIESVAKALIINGLGEVLILKLAEHKEKPEKSFRPDLPGGLVDFGETEYDAVAREISEETGITVNEAQMTMVYSDTQFDINENKSITKHLFIVKLDNKPDVNLSWEHSEFEWIALEDLQTKELRSFYDIAIEYCFSNGILTKSS